MSLKVCSCSLLENPDKRKELPREKPKEEYKQFSALPLGILEASAGAFAAEFFAFFFARITG